MKRKVKARRATSRGRGPKGPPIHSARVKQGDVPAPDAALTFAVPGVGVVRADGERVTAPAPPVTRSRFTPMNSTPALATRFVPVPEQARYHPVDCPGCVTPGKVQQDGWPTPCKCWTARRPGEDPTDTGDLSDRRWRGGEAVRVRTHADKPETFHRYFCPFFDHFPDAVPF